MEWPYLSEEKEPLSSQEIRVSANPGSLPRFSSPESSLFLNPGSMSSFSSLESKTPSNPDSEFALPSQKN